MYDPSEPTISKTIEVMESLLSDLKEVCDQGWDGQRVGEFENRRLVFLVMDGMKEVRKSFVALQDKIDDDYREDE